MKKREITYYMLPEYPVTIIEDMEEGGYTITLPDCPGCVTRCERWEDIPATIADAQREWLEVVTENITPPDPDEEEFDDEGEYQGEFKGALEEGIPIPLPQQDGSKVINISFN